MNDADYDYILDVTEHREKLVFNEMWVLIMTGNNTDGNNHTAILYVVFHYIIIKYQYGNEIWFFIFFSMFIILLGSVMFILFKINWCQNLSNSIKYGSKHCNLFFNNGRRAYYIQLFLCQTKFFLIVGIKYPRPYYADSMIHIS